MRQKKNLFGGICLLTSAVSLCIGVYFINNAYGTADQIQRRIYEASAAAQNQNYEEEAAKKETADLTDAYETAEEMGNRISELQSVFYKTSKESRDENGENDAGGEIADELKTLFTAETLSSPNMWFPIDPHSVNQDGWKFVSSWQEKDGVLPVAWYLRDQKSGDLMAFATADFNMSQNLFQNLEYGTTTEGNKAVTDSGEFEIHQSSFDELDEKSNQTIDDMLNAINESGEEPAEEYHTPADAFQAREEYMDKFMEENPDIAELYGW